MAEVSWIKLFVRMFDSSRKIKRIEKMQNGDTILIIWIKLLCLAGNINDGGAIYITPENPYDVESLADELRRPEEIVSKALDIFAQFDMIGIDESGIIHLTSWEKYQSEDKLSEIREQNRLRQAKYKKKQKALQGNVTVTSAVTLGNATEEKEEDEDKDKEFHSFTLTHEEAKLKYLGGTLGQGVVLLSDEQFDDLLDKLSIEEFNKYISIVAECELNGKPYKKKTHYQAILDMVAKDRGVKKKVTKSGKRKKVESNDEYNEIERLVLDKARNIS